MNLFFIGLFEQLDILCVEFFAFHGPCLLLRCIRQSKFCGILETILRGVNSTGLNLFSSLVKQQRHKHLPNSWECGEASASPPLPWMSSRQDGLPRRNQEGTHNP